MSPFLKVMQLFLMMTGTVLGMILLLLITPDIEDSILRVVARHPRRQHTIPSEALLFTNTVTKKETPIETSESVVHVRGLYVTVELDRNRKSFTPWANSEDCNRYHIHFARANSLPMTALVSFPGSGNTWVRYLVETATGVFTGSMYTDMDIVSRGFYGEAASPNCGCTTIQKTHGHLSMKERLKEMRTFLGRGILLLRNPYEALLSYRNFMYGGHTGFAPHNTFQGSEWNMYVSQMALAWREIAATWIHCTRQDNAMVIHYENLRKDPRTNLNSLLRFLGIAVDHGRLVCVLKHVDGPFKRQSSGPQKVLFTSKDPFTKKQHKLIDSIIQYIDRMLEQKGWERIPVNLYKFYTGQHDIISNVLSENVSSILCA